MLKIPADCTLSTSVVEHAGLVRPKVFYKVTVESLELGGMKISRFVLGRSLLLRIRLFMAKRECLRMVRKVKKFVSNQGIKV